MGDEEEITTYELIDLVLQLRGSNHATVKDIVDLRRFVHHDVLRSIDKLQHEIHNIMKRVDQRLASLIKHIPDKLNKVLTQEFQKLGTVITASVVLSNGMANKPAASLTYQGDMPPPTEAQRRPTETCKFVEQHMMNDQPSIAPMTVVGPVSGYPPPQTRDGVPELGKDLDGQVLPVTACHVLHGNPPQSCSAEAALFVPRPPSPAGEREDQPRHPGDAIPTEKPQQPYCEDLENLWSRIRPPA